jgi:hypothetical protein
MPPKHFSTLSIAAAGLAALAVAGCGADKQDDATTQAAAQAPAATTPPTTTPAATTPTQPAPAATTPATAPSRPSKPVALAVATTNRQTGALAFAMKGTVTTAGQPVPLSVRGTFDRKRQRGAFTSKSKLGTQSFTVQQILENQQLYLRSPVFAGKLPGGKSWMKVDLAEAAKTPGLNLDALGVSGPAQDPAQGLDYLQGAGAAKKLGTAKVDGVTTTHYRVQVDLKRAAKRNGKASAKRSIDRLIETLGGPTTIPVEVWVDGDHLIRRQRVDYRATVGGKLSQFDVTTDYTGFGKTVKADPPADGDTFDGLVALKRAAQAQQEAQQSQQAPQG